MCAPGSCVSRNDYYAVLDRRDQVESVLRNRIAELEATIAEMRAPTRHSFDCEWYLQGVRHNPGEYVLMRVGPATKDEQPF